MAAQSQLQSAPASTTTTPASSTGTSRGQGRGNAFNQGQMVLEPTAAGAENLDPAQVAKQAYADRLWSVGTEIMEYKDPGEQQRAARAVLGQAVEVQDEIDLGHPVELLLLPRIPEGNQGGMPFRPLPPEWIRPARILLSLAGGTGAAAPGPITGEAGIWDLTNQRSADSTSVFDKLSRIGREGADYGIYGYQTQSNNLASPEATCNATSMAMVLERLGFTRDDLVNAIELELKKKQEEGRLRKAKVPEGEIRGRVAATDYRCVMLADGAWKARVLQYLRAENGAKRGSGYQKLRGAAQTEKQMQDWSGAFEKNAGMDDLVHFILDLLGLERTAINAGANPGKVVGFVNAGTTGRTAPRTERIDAGGANTWARSKERLRLCLDQGGAAMISIRHKGRGQEGTHIVAIQAVESDGIVVDDPYGNVRPDYDAGKAGDAFSSSGSSRNRDRKNQTDRGNANDWFMSARIDTDEIKGQSNHWTDRTASSAWQYLMLFHRGGGAPQTPATTGPATTAPATTGPATH